METMIVLAESKLFYQIVNWIDLVFGIGLCFFAGRLKPKVTAGIVGIYMGAEIGLWFGLLIVDRPVVAVVGAVGGALLFASVNWGVSRGENLILGFVAVSRMMFTVISEVAYMGHADFELLYAASINLVMSVLAGIVAAVILHFRKELHMCLYRCLCSLIGTGWSLGGLYFMVKSMDYISNDLKKFSNPVDFLLPLIKLEFEEDYGFLGGAVLGAMLLMMVFHVWRSSAVQTEE